MEALYQVGENNSQIAMFIQMRLAGKLHRIIRVPMAVLPQSYKDSSVIYIYFISLIFFSPIWLNGVINVGQTHGLTDEVIYIENEAIYRLTT